MASRRVRYQRSSLAPQGLSRYLYPRRLRTRWGAYRDSRYAWCGSRLLLVTLLLCLGYGSAQLTARGLLDLGLAASGLYFLGRTLLLRLWGFSTGYSLRCLTLCLILLLARGYYLGQLEALQHAARPTEPSCLAILEHAPQHSPRGQRLLSVQLLERSAPQGQQLASPTPGASLRLLLQPDSCSSALWVGDTMRLQLYPSTQHGRTEHSLSSARPLLRARLVKRLAGSVSPLRHPLRYARRLQQQLLEYSYRLHLSPELRQLGLAMGLGYLEQDSSGQELRQHFVRAGAAPFLAVSGFHLGLILMLLHGLLALPRFEKHPLMLERFLMLSAAWGFTLLTGASLPTLRASMMLSLYYGAKVLGRRVAAAELLCLPLLLQLLLVPESFTSASLWLSYLAMLALYLYLRPLYHSLGRLRQPLLRALWLTLAMSLVIELLLLPLSLYFFGSAPLVGLVSNLILGLLAPPFVLGFLLALGLQSLGWGSRLLEQLLEQVGNTLLGCVGYCERLLPSLELHLGLSSLLLYYTVLLLLSILGLIVWEQHRAQRLPHWED